MHYLPGAQSRFNAREGLVTFPTRLEKAGVAFLFIWTGFNAREGLVTFPT